MSESNHTAPMIATQSQCDRCLHRYVGERACCAYPKEIPFDLISNRADHRKPFPGDHGIRFRLTQRYL